MRFEIFIATAILCVTRVYSDKYEDAKVTIKSLYDFDNSVYEKLAYEKQNENLIVSPLSAHFLLTLITKGARGATFEELNNALGLQYKTDGALRGYKQTLKYFKNIENATLDFANRIYVKNDLKLVDSFKGMVKYIDSDAFETFNDPHQAISEINSWVKRATNGKIDEIVNDNNLSKDTRMVLLNALYFKADWNQKFAKQETSRKNFQTTHGTKSVDTMTVMGNFKHQRIPELDNAHYIELPYTNKHLKMVIVMPRNINMLAEAAKFVKKNINYEFYEERETHLSLPKFKIESQIDFKSILNNLKVKDLFINDADLSGIAKENLFVSDIKQKAYIEVDEEGSEAAAVTVIGIQNRMGGGELFLKVDRPFYFAIQFHGIVLFEGHVVDP